MVLGERLNGLALGERDDELLHRRHVAVAFRLVEGAEGRVADAGETCSGDALGAGHAGARPVRFHARGGGAAGEAQAVYFADHGVAGHPAEAASDLAGAQAFGPVGHAGLAGPAVHRTGQERERRDRLFPDSDWTRG